VFDEAGPAQKQRLRLATDGEEKLLRANDNKTASAGQANCTT